MTSVLDAIETGLALGTNTVSVYFAKDGERIDFVENQGDWSSDEQTSVMSALESYSNYTNLTFEVVDTSAEATFKLTKSAAPQGALGFMNLPDPTLGDALGLAWFNTHFYWGDETTGLLDPGSYSYTILLHEFGHGLGLGHPHDTGGGTTIMPSIGGGLGLDQGVYTVMTYNDGWPEAPDGVPDTRAWGWNISASPIDIAVLHEKYGANPSTAAGKTTYILQDENVSGTGYQAIWDVGGVDTIAYQGARDAWIDLRAATLLAEPGGGGFVSHVADIYAGMTIAHGVVIENASGGDGADMMIGNSASNLIVGGKGADRLLGNSGHDTLNGNAGGDVLLGGTGADTLRGGIGHDTLFGGKGADVLTGGNGQDSLHGGRGKDVLTGGQGADLFVFGTSSNRDVITDFAGNDQIDLSAFNLAGYEELEAFTIRDDADTIIAFSNAAIVLIGLLPEDLTEDMFVL